MTNKNPFLNKDYMNNNGSGFAVCADTWCWSGSQQGWPYEDAL